MHPGRDGDGNCLDQVRVVVGVEHLVYAGLLELFARQIERELPDAFVQAEVLGIAGDQAPAGSLQDHRVKHRWPPDSVLLGQLDGGGAPVGLGDDPELVWVALPAVGRQDASAAIQRMVVAGFVLVIHVAPIAGDVA